MNKQIKEALALEQQAQQFLSALKNEIGAAIEATDPMPGVQISGTHPIYAVVNLSALHRHSLAPSVYYSFGTGGCSPQQTCTKADSTRASGGTGRYDREAGCLFSQQWHRPAQRQNSRYAAPIPPFRY